MRLRVSLILAIFITVLTVQSATITVNPAITYQTIEGFGAFGGNCPEWQSCALYTDAFVSTIVNDLGISMLRHHYVTNATTLEYYRKLKAAGLERLILSTWSPPASWKSNNSEINGGTLLPQYYDDMGEFAAGVIRTIREQTGIEVYGISLQNEPAFSQPYASCVYTPAEYRDLIKVAGPIIRAEAPDVKIFGAEHMLSNWGTFEGTLMADPLSREQMGALAVHGYLDGVRPSPSSGSHTLWSRAASNCASVGKNLWMTETSGYLHSSWADCLHLAEMIYAGLKYGKITAWVWWQLGETPHANPDDDRYSLMLNGNPTKLYYVSKNYYRYIRPGAVQVESASDDSLVFVTTFLHEQNRTFTAVVLNSSSQTKTASISGAPAQSFRAYRSSAAQNCVDIGTLQASSISLPASSVTTLFAEDITVSRQKAAPALRPTMRRSSAVHTQYGIDGRRIPAADVGARGIWLYDCGAMIRTEVSVR